jgi:hypothetical protein
VCTAVFAFNLELHNHSLSRPIPEAPGNADKAGIPTLGNNGCNDIPAFV